MTFLIIGATGNVGRQVVHQLCERGTAPRAFVRDVASAGLPTGVDMVCGDLTAPDTLEAALAALAALAGVDVVFLVCRSSTPSTRLRWWRPSPGTPLGWSTCPRPVSGTVPSGRGIRSTSSTPRSSG